MIELRDLTEADLPALYELMREREGVHMAAFTRHEPFAAFAERFRRSWAADTWRRAIVVGGDFVGFVSTFLHGDETHVTYWIARPFWGRGIATEALAALVEGARVRPIHASAAADNVGSIRVLEKCGFVAVRSERAFADARNGEIEEVFFVLR